MISYHNDAVIVSLKSTITLLAYEPGGLWGLPNPPKMLRNDLPYRITSIGIESISFGKIYLID